MVQGNEQCWWPLGISTPSIWELLPDILGRFCAVFFEAQRILAAGGEAKRMIGGMHSVSLRMAGIEDGVVSARLGLCKRGEAF